MRLCIHIHIHKYLYIRIYQTGIPWWPNSKEYACNGGDAGLIPGLGRSPWGGNGHPLQYSCLGNPMDRGACLATVHGVAKRQDMTEWLSVHAGACTHPHTHISDHIDLNWNFLWNLTNENAYLWLPWRLYLQKLVLINTFYSHTCNIWISLSQHLVSQANQYKSLWAA